MKSRLVLVCAAVALGALGWFVQALGGRPLPGGGAAPRAPAEAEGTGRDARATSRSRGATEPSGRSRDGIDVADAEARMPYAPSEVDLRWIEGRVVVPVDTPEDEECWVLAAGGPVRRAARIEVDGRFRLGFPEGVRRARLTLRARYLHLASDRGVEAEVDAAEPVVLEPRVGGRIVGRVALDAGEEEEPDPLLARAAPDELEAADALVGQVVALSGRRPVARVALDGAPTFELDAVPPGDAIEVVFEGEATDDSEPVVVALAPGETVEVRLSAGAGVSVEGVVLTDDGAPVPNALVVARGTTEGASGFDEPFLVSNTTSANGAFRIRCARAKTMTLEVDHPDCAPLSRDVPELAHTDRVKGVRLVLDSGGTITGRVVFASGRAAPGADVTCRLGTDVASASDWSVEVASDGWFEIRGLPAGPVALRARAIVAGSEQFGVLENVLPGARGVVLRIGDGRSIAGSVVDDDGNPIDEFTLRVDERLDGASLAGINRHWRTYCERRAVGAKGVFELSGLPSGELRIRAFAPGYTPSNAVVVERGSGSASVTLVVDRTIEVSGVVVGPRGATVADASVRARALDVTDHGAYANGGARTDSGGRFVLDRLAAGTIELEALGAGFGKSARVLVDLGAGESREGIVLRLTAGASVSGIVLDPDGEPEVGCSVTFVTERDLGAGGSTATTDDAGRFRFVGLPAGRGRVSVPTPAAELRALFGEAPSPSEVDSLERFALVELEEGVEEAVVLAYDDLNPVRLLGRVRSNGTPVVDAFVFARSSTGDDDLASGSAVPSTSTNGEGRFTLVVSRPGEYDVSVHHPDVGGVSRRVDVPDVELFEVDFELVLGSIEGTVRDGEGTPLAGIHVFARAEERPSGAPATWSSGVTDARGRYVVEGLADATYVVIAGAEIAEAPASDAPASEASLAVTTRAGIVVEGGAAVRDVDFELVRGGTIAGVVRRGETPAEGGYVAFAHLDGEAFAAARVDALGRFASSSLPVGELVVIASDPFRRTSRPRVVSVVAGSTSEIELALLESGSLRVVLLDAEGASAKGTVSLRDAGAYGLHFMEDRSWLVERLAAGTYTVDAEVEGARRSSEVTIVEGVEAYVELSF